MREFKRNSVGCATHMLWIRCALVTSALFVGNVGAAAAQPAAGVAVAAPSAVLGVVPKTKLQARLELRRSGAEVEAAVCSRICDWTQSTRWTLPEPFATAPGAFSVLELGSGRRAARFIVEAADRQFEWVLAAPLSQGVSAEPAPDLVVAFAGEVGLSEGEAPDRRGQVVDIQTEPGKPSTVLVGQVREDVSLCGRRALLVPKVLHAESLSMRRVKVQRLSKAERDAAPNLGATPLTNQVPSGVFGARVASSAKGSPAALTDGDPTTVWTENRSGDGGGEFVVLRAPASIGLTGLVFSLPERPNAGYVPPKTLWVATDDAVFHVDLTGPVGASASPGAEPPAVAVAPAPAPQAAAPEPALVENQALVENPTQPVVGGSTHVTQWYVPFPAPVNTSCLAISLESATAPAVSAQPGAQPEAFDVGLAEIAATTDVDEGRLNQALADLDTGGDAATAAERLLADVGRTAFDRIKKRYRGYSESGRMRALNVMDAASCGVAVPVYVNALYNQDTAESEHGERKLAACKRQAVPALARRLAKAGSERSRILATNLVHLDPVSAVDAMAPLLSGGSRAKRRVLRLAFAAASEDERSKPRVVALLADPQLDAARGLQIMRALGARLADYRQVALPRLRQWLAATDFDTRYLLLAPAAQLASFDASLAKHLVATLSAAKEAPLRAEAARWAPVLAATQQALVAATADPQVRVREAAVTNLGQRALEAARPALLVRLSSDPWPLVRSAAVRALEQLPANAETSQQLAQTALGDESATVRRPALYVLGKLNATAQLPAVRQVFQDDADMHVRATAAATLGVLCDHSMTQALTQKALRYGVLTAPEAERVVGKASLSALGRLAPADLAQRLAPFFDEGVPRDAQLTAKAALSHPDRCPRK